MMYRSIDADAEAARAALGEEVTVTLDLEAATPVQRLELLPVIPPGLALSHPWQVTALRHQLLRCSIRDRDDVVCAACSTPMTGGAYMDHRTPSLCDADAVSPALPSRRHQHE